MRYNIVVSFISGGNQRKQPTSRKQMINLEQDSNTQQQFSHFSIFFYQLSGMSFA
jgi:hypothetical protein